LAPLAGPPLSYPGADTSNTGSRDARALPSLADVVAQLTSPQAMFLPIDPTRYRDAAWAIPLWSERGLIGLLLLGEKRDGGLYTQEEIEIARASGERLVDTQASAEMARRLMALQRQRLAEGQVLDRRTRRVLHDEVLPALHTAMLNLNDGAGEALPLLAGLHRQISDLLHDAPASATPQVARLGLPGALRHAVEEEFAGAFDAVRWHIDPCTEAAAARLPPLTTEVLYYAAREVVRNAARHGRGGVPERPLHLDLWLDWDCEASPWDGGLRLAVEDDGVGIALPTSPEEGQGLALHGTMMAVVGGSLELESLPGLHTRVTLRLPPLDDPLSPPGTNTFPLEAYS
jgi:signal transduction histidine kinase